MYAPSTTLAGDATAQCEDFLPRLFRYLRAQASISALFHTRPADNSASGAGKSPWVSTIRLTRWRVTPRSCATSATPTRCLVIDEKVTSRY